MYGTEPLDQEDRLLIQEMQEETTQEESKQEESKQEKAKVVRRPNDLVLDDAARKCGNFDPLFGVDPLNAHNYGTFGIMPGAEHRVDSGFQESLLHERFHSLGRVNHDSKVYVLRAHPDSKATATTIEDTTFVMCGPYLLSHVVTQRGFYGFTDVFLREEREEEKEIAAERAQRSNSICTSRISKYPHNWPDDIVDDGTGTVAIRLSRVYTKQEGAKQEKRTHSHELPVSNSKKKKPRTDNASLPAAGDETEQEAPSEKPPSQEAEEEEEGEVE